MDLTYEEVIFNNGDITKRLGIFHTVCSNQMEEDIKALTESLSKTHSASFELEDYGEGYVVFRNTDNNDIIYLAINT